MKKTNPFLLTLSVMWLSWMSSCAEQNTPKEIVMPDPWIRDAQYYENLRAYKNSPHQVFFTWHEDYSDSVTMGSSFQKFPDSIDIVSLWGGIPYVENSWPHKGSKFVKITQREFDDYRFTQKVKGTKMVGVCFDELPDRKVLSDEEVKKYCDPILRIIAENDLDGWDFDFESLAGDDAPRYQNLSNVIKYLGQFMGPKSPHPEKYLIIDGVAIPSKTSPYITYFVKQCYNINSPYFLQLGLKTARPSGKDQLPSTKYIITISTEEQFSDTFTDVKGNKIQSLFGGNTRQLEGFARWNPTEGPKGGCGVYVIKWLYKSDPPYIDVRRAIQIMNPRAIQIMNPTIK